MSLATVPAGDKQPTEHQNTEGERRGHHGRGKTSKATETWLAGRGGRVALGSYRQSGGANSTRKTWGALVGETGTWSHLTRTITLGEPGGTVRSWELCGEVVLGVFQGCWKEVLSEDGHRAP